MTLDEIQRATAQDRTLQCITHLARTQEWDKLETLPPEYQDIDRTELNLFKHVKDELTVNDQSNIILRGHRIIVPTSLREKAISIAHEGHQGLVKTKQLLREKVWFPNIDSFAKRLIDTCIACQANGPENRPDPLQMSSLPPTPWHTTHMDFCGPFPSGEYLFVVMDAYSRFPEVDIVSSTSAASIIPKLDRMFAVHGIPAIICSDNGPPFTSHEIQQYMQENGIQHRRVTPLWPQANSEAENFMKPLTKAIRSAHAEGKQWTKHLYTFLLNYRTTPHITTKFALSELLFNRKVHNKLPQLQTLDPKISDAHAQAKENDITGKSKMKEQADLKRRARPSQLKIGDTVLARQRKQNKLSTRFDPNPFQVKKKIGTMITACRNGKYITRNISHFKVINNLASQDTTCPYAEELDNESDTTCSYVEGEEDDNEVTPNGRRAASPQSPFTLRRSTRTISVPQRYGQFGT